MILLFPSLWLNDKSKLPHCKSILGLQTKVRLWERALNTLHHELGAHFLNPLGRVGLLTLGGNLNVVLTCRHPFSLLGLRQTATTSG